MAHVNTYVYLSTNQRLNNGQNTMSLSQAIKKKFEERMGLSISDMSESLFLSKTNNKAKNDYGRGYVHFGKSIDPKQKEKENIKILSNW